MPPNPLRSRGIRHTSSKRKETRKHGHHTVYIHYSSLAAILQIDLHGTFRSFRNLLLGQVSRDIDRHVLFPLRRDLPKLLIELDSLSSVSTPPVDRERVHDPCPCSKAYQHGRSSKREPAPDHDAKHRSPQQSLTYSLHWHWNCQFLLQFPQELLQLRHRLLSSLPHSL